MCYFVSTKRVESRLNGVSLYLHNPDANVIARDMYYRLLLPCVDNYLPCPSASGVGQMEKISEEYRLKFNLLLTKVFGEYENSYLYNGTEAIATPSRKSARYKRSTVPHESSGDNTSAALGASNSPEVEIEGMLLEPLIQKDDRYHLSCAPKLLRYGSAIDVIARYRDWGKSIRYDDVMCHFKHN